MTEQELRTALQMYVLDPTYRDGWARNIYGDTEKINEILMQEYAVNMTENRKLCFPLVRVTLDGSPDKDATVKERMFFIWKKIVMQLSEVLPNPVPAAGMSAEKAEKTQKKLVKNQAVFLTDPPQDEVVEDADIYRNKLLESYYKLGVYPVIVVDHFDAVQHIFPDNEEAGGYFFQDLFDLTPKSSEENKSKILLISEHKARNYAHHMAGGSDFIAAYPEVCLEDNGE